MSQQGLERVDVPAVAQELDGEGMAEAMGMDVGNSGAFADRT